MEQSKTPQKLRKFKIYRKPSSNTSIESAESLLIKKKYIMEKSDTSLNKGNNKNNLVDFGLSRKLKICDGEKLSYEVIKKDSKQKRAQFLQKYSHDPFLRKKFEKSVQKFNHSKSKQVSKQKKLSTTVSPTKKKFSNQTYTTFRQQKSQESQKTVKLINNCKQLVDELKKNRLEKEQSSNRNEEGMRRFHHFERNK